MLEKLQQLLTKEHLTIPNITNDNDYGKASDSIAFLNKHIATAEKYRKIEVAPLIEQKAEIDSTYKKFTKPLENVVSEIKNKMLEYSKKQKAAQLLLEQEAIKQAEATGQSEVLIEDLSVQKNKSEFSTSTITKTAKFRFKISKLNEVIEIPPLKMKKYLEDGNEFPYFIERYEEESVTVRKSF
jgi:hypothetical protein